MSLRLGGLISGADTETLIHAIMEMERVRVYRQEEKQSQLEAKQKAWRDVRSSLTNIQSKLDQLRFPTLFRARKVELSDDSVATVTADAGAAQTSYMLRVVQLAQSHVITTGDSDLFKTADEQLLWTGSFQIGTNPDDLKSVNVEDTDTLSSLAAKINAADSGVMAQVVMVEDNKFRLVLTAKQSGEANQITFAGGSGLLDGILGLTGPARLELSAAQDAQIELNGQTYTRSTNTFDNILPGLKITAKKPSTEAVSVIVTADADKAVQAVKDWVSAINSLQDQLKTLSAYDIEKKVGSPLTGESLVRTIQYYLRQPFSARVEGLPESMNMLSQIGISSGAYGSANFGRIVVDEQKLKEALRQDPEAVARLFGIDEDPVTDGDGNVITPARRGIAVQMNEYIKSILDISSGPLEAREKSLSAQISRIKDTIERIELQLEQREKVLRLQFTRMEEAMARMQSQGNYLAAMLLGGNRSV